MARRWDRRKVIEAIRDRQRMGLPLVGIRRHDRSLYAAACKYWGGWHRAVREAGFDVKPKRQWTKRRLLEAVQAWHAKGLPMSKLRRHDSGLYASASRHFGSWRDTLLAAGLPAGKPRRPSKKWTRDNIIQGIQAWHDRNSPVSRTWNDYQCLHRAATRCFGTWQKALEAAGLPPTHTTWTKQRVVRALQERHKQGRTVRPSDRGTLAAAARYHFGSLIKASLVANIEPKPSPSWTRQRIVQAIRSRHQRGLAITQVWHGDHPLYVAALHRFGSWPLALAAAGIEAPCRRRWSRQTIIREIQAFYSQNRPKASIYREDRKLVGAAKKHFGTWQQALIAAGLREQTLRSPRKWSRDRVVQEIRRLRLKGLKPSAIREGDEGLYRAAKTYCGGWYEALRAGGFPIKRRRCWTAEQILEELRRRDAGSLTRVWADDPQFYSASQRAFGSWRAAIDAAGLQPRPYRRWTRRRVLREIQLWHDRGQLVDQPWKRHESLYHAGCRLFGSWHKALQAAGIASQPKIKWTRELIVMKLQSCRDLKLAEIAAKYPALVSSARHYFGTLNNALRAADVRPQPRGLWSKSRVISHIQDRYVRNLPVTSAGSNKSLRYAARRHFGSWEKALEAAGVVRAEQ